MTDPITRLNVALEGRYRIERELGEGGMATVYLADDLKHERKVALKVLKPELAVVVGAERFLAEIKTTANLQHPHILPLHDSGQADSFLFYVMPYVEGESLRDRLDREHQLPVDEAVRIAQNVAEALDYAHQKGVIHRDIKPANILLLQGKPVLSDFGIALAVGAAGGGRLTETGLSMGTPHYMSPEQATGDLHVGPATDVYALGCVLYEMLAGEPPYTGSTPQAILGKILTEPPAQVTKQRKSVPPNVQAVISRALEKVPADRFRSAEAFATALENQGFTHAPGSGAVTGRKAGVSGAGRGPGRGVLLPWAITAAALVTLGVAWLGRGDSRPGATRADRFYLGLPDGTVPYRNGGIAVSPDGDQVVLTATVDEGTVLLRRRLEDWTWARVAGSEGSNRPSFSHDGSRLGWTRRAGGLFVAPADGGAGILRVDSVFWGDPTWTNDGDLVYQPLFGEGLWQLEDGADQPRRLTVPDSSLKELGHWFPQALPDGEHVLYSSYSVPVPQAGIWVVSLETGERRQVVPRGYDARYYEPGILTFVRGSSLVAQRFDLDRLETVGPDVPVVDGIYAVYEWRNYGLSDTGTLVYWAREDIAGLRPPAWVARDGNTTVLPECGAELWGNFSLSSSGDRAVAGFAPPDGVWGLYTIDLNRCAATRVGNPSLFTATPILTADGSTVVYAEDRSGTYDIYMQAADGTGVPVLLADQRPDEHPLVVTPDSMLLYFSQTELRGGPLLRVPLEPGAAPDTLRPRVHNADISPDGRWLALESTESERSEVEVWSYPGFERRLQASRNGGVRPRWTKGGRELVYLSGGDMTAVSFDPATGTLGTEQVLFPSPFLGTSYDVTADGERFLIDGEPRDAPPARLRVVTNFLAEVLAMLEAAGG